MVNPTVASSKRHSISYDTDKVAGMLFPLLLRDFRTIEGSSFCAGAESAYLKGIAEYRDYKYPELGIIPVGRFKRYKQLESLYKKYSFKADKYTDTERQALTLEKYFSEQLSFSNLQPRSALASLVCRRARKIARGILGKYDPEFTVSAGEFGKKSSIGCPLSLAYIDHKLTSVKAFTSSSECAKWFFDTVVVTDPIMAELVENLQVTRNDPTLAHESLSLVLAPKTWKIQRPITPLTLLTLFYSFGVGRQVEQRLKSVGLDIRRLQKRHRAMVERFSESLHYATADLSSASQSLTSELLNRTLPREWYCAIKKTFSHQILVEGKATYAESVLPMGNGLTFPVETLVFYSILKAICELSKVKGFVSVYGDDLIYPSRLHPYVAVIFPQLGFKLNLDKTFVKAPFRESCGSDFYRGCDVRPAYLPERCVTTNPMTYAMWLYKAYNALVRRWDECEIRSCLLYLITELAQLDLPLLRVPPCFPDTAGVKVLNCTVIPCDTRVLPWHPIAEVFCYGSRWYTFAVFTSTPRRRDVVSILPYYWQQLAQTCDTTPPDDGRNVELYPLLDTPRQPLQWRRIKRVRYRKVSKTTRERVHVVSYSATCASRKEMCVSVGEIEAGLISDWL